MKKNLFAIVAVALSAVTYAGAQDEGFDLSSQRLESQLVPSIPGHKCDHKGMPLNPTPQQMEFNSHGHFTSDTVFKIKDPSGMFENDIDFITTGRKGIILYITFGENEAKKHCVKPVEGAYSLEISEKGIYITGYDHIGAFYGIQTLRQIVRSGHIPYLSINDWPDLKRRGVVEGFYGTPWSHEVRLSLIDFYGKFKMNTYIYGPKDDPYHSCPNWRLPYPEDEARKIGELVQACIRNRVDFVWAIHPGQDIKWNEEDFCNLLDKFNMMYNLGVRSFAIFFDDISGEGTNPLKQCELLNRLNREFVQAKKDVRPLIVCPTDYSKLWANPSENGPLNIYGRELDPGIDIFWTGDFVCSDLTHSTMEWLNSRIRRPGFYWWNFPVTDYARHILMLGPAYGLDTTLTGNDLCGIVSNPMEHGTASRLGLYGCADYSWNIKAYNPIDNWERAIEEEVPEAKEAYRRFAIHCCDTETGYRRNESWETETFRIDDYTQEQFDALMTEFTKIEQTPEELETICKNEQLLSEIHPWLAEFQKLGSRGRKVLELIKLLEQEKYDKFWRKYVSNIMGAEDIEAYNAHKSGTLKLQPFYENAMDDMANKVYFQLAGKKSAYKKGIGSFANVYTTLGKLMFDNDSTTYYTSGSSQNNKSWTGVDLGDVIAVSEIQILQGRNSVDDVDYYDHATLEYSVDGKHWNTLIDDMVGQYIINWKGESVQARFIRLRKLESAKTNWAAIRSFDVNPITVDNLGFKFHTGDMRNAIKAFDRDIQSYYTSDGLCIELSDGVSEISILTGKPKNGISIVQKDKYGKCLSHEDFTCPVIKTIIPKVGSTTVTIEGKVDIHEIIIK